MLLAGNYSNISTAKKCIHPPLPAAVALGKAVDEERGSLTSANILMDALL